MSRESNLQFGQTYQSFSHVSLSNLVISTFIAIHFPPFPFYVFVNVIVVSFPVIRSQKTYTLHQPPCDILLHSLCNHDSGGQDNCVAPLDRIFYSCGNSLTPPPLLVCNPFLDMFFETIEAHVAVGGSVWQVSRHSNLHCVNQVHRVGNRDFNSSYRFTLFATNVTCIPLFGFLMFCHLKHLLKW